MSDGDEKMLAVSGESANFLRNCQLFGKCRESANFFDHHHSLKNGGECESDHHLPCLTRLVAKLGKHGKVEIEWKMNLKFCDDQVSKNDGYCEKVSRYWWCRQRWAGEVK